jgi:hypothetical protein
MAISAGRTATISESGSTDWVKLSRGFNRVLVSASDWGSQYANLQYSEDAVTVYHIDDVNSIGMTANSVRTIKGVGYVRLTGFLVTSPITLKVQQPLDFTLQ